MGGAASLSNGFVDRIQIVTGGAARCCINAISSGWIDTTDWHADDHAEMLQHSLADRMQRTAEHVDRPEDIAPAVLFLLDSANIFVNGQNLTVDGGMNKLMIYHDGGGWSTSPRLYKSCTRPQALSPGTR